MPTIPELTEADQAEGWTVAVWTYAGVRLSGKDVKRAGWYTGTDFEHGPSLWPAGKAAEMSRLIVGGRYWMRTRTDADGQMWQRGNPVWTGDRHDDAEQVSEWQAAELAAERRQTALSFERSAKRVSALDEALEPLLNIAAGLNGPDMDVFTSYIIRRFHQARYEGRRTGVRGRNI